MIAHDYSSILTLSNYSIPVVTFEAGLCISCCSTTFYYVSRSCIQAITRGPGGTEVGMDRKRKLPEQSLKLRERRGVEDVDRLEG